MKRLFLIAALLVALPAVLAAQTPQPTPSNKEYRAHGYAFAAPGAYSDYPVTTLHFGAGGEGLLYKGFGVGGEIGYVAPARSLGDGFGILSVDGQYHFLKASKSGKIVPFVTGGYSLFFRSDSLNAVNFGAGVNYWFKERTGLRFEFRDHVPPQTPDFHVLGFRVGITFR